MKSIEGPKAVTSIKTPYDDLLNCMKHSYKGKRFSVAVGAVTDETGKFSIGDTGNGKYITQAAGDIVQSALLQTVAVGRTAVPAPVPVTTGAWSRVC